MSKKFIRRLVLIIGIVLSIGVAFWLYVCYDDRDFLRYGVLRINKFPESLKLIDYDVEGISDFGCDYNITINSNDFNKLLAGRKYVKLAKVDDASPFFPPQSFEAKSCYQSGILRNGIVNIFVNKDTTKVYVVYNVN